MKFLPTRQKYQAESAPVMVADLDALLTKTFTFKLFGKIHKIEPMEVGQFLEFTSAYQAVIDLKDKEVVTPKDLVAAYGNLIASTGCKTISKSDVEKMRHQQVAALFQIMTDLHTGKLFADEKKSLEKVQSLLFSEPSQ